MSLSYEFSIGSVRAKEKSLLTMSDIEQMIGMKTEAEIVRFLKDKGFGDGETIDEIIVSNTDKMWKYIRGVAPNMEVFSPFYLQNDIHNLKTLLKAVMADREYKDLLMYPVSVDVKLLLNAVENGKFDKLPQWLSDAAQKAYKLLAQTNDARLSDAVIDCAALKKMLDEGRRSRSEYLYSYFESIAFYSNVKVAIRGARTNSSADYLKTALCEMDGFDKSAVIPKALTGTENLLKYFEKLDTCDCNKAMAAFRENPGEFEKFIDNRLIKLAKTMCKLKCEGSEPLLGYYTACEYERKAVHIISGGIVTHTPPEKIRERLREIYG